MVIRLAKRRDKLSTVRIAENLASEIDRIVQSDAGKNMGFRSRADFVTNAVRDFMRQDLTPVYVPAEIVRLVNDLVEHRKRWTSVQEFVLEAVKLRLREYEAYR